MLLRSYLNSCLVRLAQLQVLYPLTLPCCDRSSFAEQFSKYANVFFLFTACIQQIPGVSPTKPYTTIVPLAVVLLASAIKEFQEDLKRHQSDAELNARKAKILQPDGSFLETKWKDIRVGDVVRMESDDFIPADVVLITSSEPEGFCYIETSNLDGCVQCFFVLYHEIQITS